MPSLVCQNVICQKPRKAGSSERETIQFLTDLLGQAIPRSQAQKWWLAFIDPARAKQTGEVLPVFVGSQIFRTTSGWYLLERRDHGYQLLP